MVRKAVFAAALLSATLFATQLGAALLNETKPQTRDGQNFRFVFRDAPTIASGADAILTLTARGDYSAGFTHFEFANLRVENVLRARRLGPDNSTILAMDAFDDLTWRRTFTLAYSDVVQLLRDQVIRVSVNLSRGVDWDLPADAYVSLGIDYRSATSMDTPGVLGLLGLGLAALGLAGRQSRGRAHPA